MKACCLGRKGFVKDRKEPCVMVCTCNLSTQEVEAGGLQVQGQPGLLGEICIKKKKKEKRKK
jgi:hypothetical protein